MQTTATATKRMYFRGTRAQCPNPAPHLPHVTASYRTGRDGWLTDYCRGVSDGTNFTALDQAAGNGTAAGVYIVEAQVE